jgi:hypothetical protein
MNVGDRVHYAGTLGEYDGTVAETDPLFVVNLDGIGLVLTGEDTLSPLDEAVPEQPATPSVEPEPLPQPE